MGDTLGVITLRYCRPPKDYLALLDLNAKVLRANNYIMREGDPIQIPESWFPIQTIEYKMKFRGSHGTRI